MIIIGVLVAYVFFFYYPVVVPMLMEEEKKNQDKVGSGPYSFKYLLIMFIFLFVVPFFLAFLTGHIFN